MIVEDEPLIAMNLEQNLQALGFCVKHLASSHEIALQKLYLDAEIDVILMDINIHGPIHGIDSANILYEIFHIPIVYLTSYCDEETLSLVENSMASGYLMKPYKVEELRVLLNLCIRRHKQHNHKKSKFLLKNNYHYDLTCNCLFYKNEKVKLTKKEQKLIDILCQHMNSFVYYEKIFNHIWETAEVDLNKIRGCVFRLKQKFPDLCIQNNYELGYSIE